MGTLELPPSTPERQPKAAFTLPSLAQVCQSPQDFLGTLDVAALNLMCAGGLPHADNLDIPKLLEWLEKAAEQVEYETRRHWYRFSESPQQYLNSPGYFCCYYLLQVLQEDFKVRYNPARIVDEDFQNPKCLNPDFKDSRDLFIHGIIDGPGGTCASVPVIYVAVGRRLGYPLKLVEARGHLFFRWDDPLGEQRGVPERFNIEGTGLGISTYPDAFYENWPEPWSDAEKAGGWYLKSLSPAAELAGFLATRGECFADNGRTVEAIQAYQWACRLMPEDIRYRGQLAKYVRRSQEAKLAIEEMRFFQRQAMETAERQGILHGKSAETPKPPHGDYCQCFHCKQARQLAARQQGAFGHPTGCLCNQCERVKQAGGQGQPGHGSNCGCALCNRARLQPANQMNPFNPW